MLNQDYKEMSSILLKKRLNFYWWGACEDKTNVRIEGLDVPIISKHKLIMNKKSTGRPKDSLDADRLENL